MRFISHMIRGPRAVSAARTGAQLYVLNERSCWIEACPEVLARAIRVEEAHEAQVYGVEECPETLARIAGVEWAERLWRIDPRGTLPVIGTQPEVAEAEAAGIDPKYAEVLNTAARMRWAELVKATDPKRFILADRVVAAWKLLQALRLHQGKPYENKYDREGWLLACRPEGATLLELADAAIPPARAIALIEQGVLVPKEHHGR